MIYPENVTINTLITYFKLEKIYTTPESEEKQITCIDINRPGLQIAGFYDCFDKERIQILGMVEHTYLSQLPEADRKDKLHALIKTGITALIITRRLEVFPEIYEYAKEYNVPVLRTEHETSSFMSALISYLRTALAKCITRHGVLVEVYGEGILILGESGVGKSETAVELIKRGHRLIADDAVEIRKVSDISLVGSSPEMIRHFIEIRGIGIIDVKRLFGLGSVKDTEKINMVINLEPWVEGKHYDRLGLTDETTNIMGIEVPSLLIPVKPGRNLAIIVEIAAMNNRQKRMGYNAAEEINKRFMSEMDNTSTLI